MHIVKSRRPDHLVVGLADLPLPANPALIPRGQGAVLLGLTSFRLSSADLQTRVGDSRRRGAAGCPACWADGQPLRAADLELTRRIANDGPLPSDVRVEVRHRLGVNPVVRGVEASGYPLPSRLELPRYQGDRCRYRSTSRYQVTPTHPGLYCGPYRIISTDLQDHAVLEANGFWAGEQTFFKMLSLRRIPDPHAMLSNLLHREVDCINWPTEYPKEIAQAFVNQHQSRFRMLNPTFAEGHRWIVPIWLRGSDDAVAAGPEVWSRKQP